MIEYFIENSYIEQNKFAELCNLYNMEFETVNMFLLKNKLIEIEDKNNRIIFRYVGLVSIGNLIMFILPKYVKELTDINSNKDHAKLILMILQKYVESKRNLPNYKLETLNFTDEDLIYNKIAILKYFISDYIENGLYTNNRREYIKNGVGKIEWNKTIQNNSVIVSRGIPIYVDIITDRTNIDNENIIRAVHRYIIAQAIEFFGNLDLIECSIDLDECCDLPFDDINYILQILNSRLNIEFKDRNIRLIRAMKIFLNNENKLDNDIEVNIYGTREFEYVWEEICSQIFNNEYLNSIDEIEKPIFCKKDCSFINETRGTLKPDVVSYDNDILYILDAKYYDFHFNSEGKIIGKYPDTYDIVKQLAYEDKMKKRKLSGKIINIFSIPSFNSTEVIGNVKFELFNTNGVINILNVNVNEAYDKYLNQTFFELNKII